MTPLALCMKNRTSFDAYSRCLLYWYTLTCLLEEGIPFEMVLLISLKVMPSKDSCSWITEVSNVKDFLMDYVAQRPKSTLLVTRLILPLIELKPLKFCHIIIHYLSYQTCLSTFD